MIEFRKLRMTNFLPYGDTQVLEIKNGINIILGKNGYGKSSIISALNFVLFGNDYGKKKVNDLINKYRKKEMLVELELEFKGNSYKIRRGKKPDLFEIFKNGELLSQDSKIKDYQKKLETMLNLNENIFKQLVALGANVSGVKHFMDLSPKEKEEVLQVMLDTKLFSVLSQIVKEEKRHFLSIIENKESELSIILKNEEHNKKILKDIKTQNENILKNRDEKIKELKEELQQNENKRKEIEPKLAKKEKLEEKLKELKESGEELKEKVNKCNVSYTKIETSLKNIQNSDIITCPECGNKMNITELKVGKKEDELKKHLDEISKKCLTFKEDLDIIITEKKKYESANKKLIQLENEFNELIRKDKYLNSQIKDLAGKEVVSTKEIEETLKEINTSIKDIKSDLEELQVEVNDLYQIEKLLSNDALKGVIIEKKLPLLNKYINEYLEKFEVDYQFFITSKLKEVIKRRDEDFAYHNLSNGEKQRIILSILFAFLKLLEHNVKINVLFLDEFLDSALDDEGSQAVLNILETEFKNKAIFIITHKQEIKEIDSKTIYLEKDKNNKFSLIKQ